LRLWKSWIVATKDFSVFRKNKYVFYSLIAMPLLLGVVLPLVALIGLSTARAGMSNVDFTTEATSLITLFASYFVVVAAVLPTVIASYSFVGEKIEKSLEPLLATPTSDSELLLGKSLAALIPCLGATFIGAAVFVVLVDVWSQITLGVLLLPTLDFGLLIGLLVPVTCVLSIESNVIISSRVNDVRAAQQLGGFVVLPLILVLVLAPAFGLASTVLLYLGLSGILAVAAVILFFLSRATFKREEILTKWK
jgi:ABC-type transport system involved in multi-copper enzyme maturation permease subunit